MTGDTNAPCTAHRAVRLAFDELGWKNEGRLTLRQIAAYAATRGRSEREVLRVLGRAERLGTIRVHITPAGLAYERVDQVDANTIRELRHHTSPRPASALHHKPQWEWRRRGGP